MHFFIFWSAAGYVIGRYTYVIDTRCNWSLDQTKRKQISKLMYCLQQTASSKRQCENKINFEKKGRQFYQVKTLPRALSK